MPLRLDIKRRLTARSDRVKSTDLHPGEPWMLASLYNGNVHIWNYESQTLVKSFEVCDLPVRAGVFAARKNWVLTGSDDMKICVFNYNTLERVSSFEAHSDYLRSLAVHPSQPFVLSCSDDMFIKLWNWEKKWNCQQVFDGHTHYVMRVVFNPKDANTFASASLDRTIKVWQLGSTSPNFTLNGHEAGVNCVDYYHGGDKPYLISGADDRLVKIWDYQNKNCVQTLEGHTTNISAVCFHPELPIILTGSEDGTVRLWHATTYRLENTLNYGLERVWSLRSLPGSNNVALGYDEGSILIKLGKEEPAMSLDAGGKLVMARVCELQQGNLKALGADGGLAEVKDGERIPLVLKDMGACEVYPQSISHNSNGRFVVVCGDGEYIVYTAMALRNKSFGSALEFVWAAESSEFAIRVNSSLIKVHKNFKERKSLKPDLGAEAIFGGALLGVKSSSSLSFYDWESLDLVRRIEIQPKNVFWSENGDLVAIVSEDSYFILRHDAEAVSAAREGASSEINEDGIEDAFEILGKVPEAVKTGVWVGDCFIYTNALNRLNYYVGGEIVTISHLDRTMYILGYIPSDNRLYLGDKELSIVSFSLRLSVLEYQTAVMRRDFATADKVLPTIPKDARVRVAHFLEKQDFKKQALVVTSDPEHKFELAISLGDLSLARSLVLEVPSEAKWKTLSELAIQHCEFDLASECLHNAGDSSGLLLLASSLGKEEALNNIKKSSGPLKNISFLSSFLLGDLKACLSVLINSGRFPEAALFARSYMPSSVPEVLEDWKEALGKVSLKASQGLADPKSYPNLFESYEKTLRLEEALKRNTPPSLPPAYTFPSIQANDTRVLLEEDIAFLNDEGPLIEDKKFEKQEEEITQISTGLEESSLKEEEGEGGGFLPEPIIPSSLSSPLSPPLYLPPSSVEKAIHDERGQEKPPKLACEDFLGSAKEEEEDVDSDLEVDLDNITLDPSSDPFLYDEEELLSDQVQ